MLEKIKRTPILVIPEIDDKVFLEAGRLKAAYKISLADSIAVASASVSGAALITADHHELDAVEATERIRFFWIR
jgi:predicted nucleic acid-binding protein